MRTGLRHACVLTLAAMRLAVSSNPTCSNPHVTIGAAKVMVRGDVGYDAARLSQFAQYLGTAGDASTRLRPALVVYCTDEAHVQSAVQFAGLCGYKVTVRSGGHSYTGSSSCNFQSCMQLDLTGMNATSFQGATITAQPGVRLVDFATATAKHFLSVPHGGCGGVGLGGHLQSSAWGMMSHSHGSGLDHVVSFRMVLANGTVLVASRSDPDPTVYKSVLGSAPGSWGIITEYKLAGVPDLDAPFTRMMIVTIPYSRANFLAAFKHAQFVMMDQETRMLRDMKLLLVAEPPTDSGDDTVCYIKGFCLWTGVDSGQMTATWTQLYLQPFHDIGSKPFPSSFNIPMTLSLATRLMATRFTNHNDRYSVQAFHSDHWWGDDFLEMMADEVDERVAMIPDVYPSFQFLPLGMNTQWARNAGMNALTWRDTRAYVDDWMFVKNESAYPAVRERMRNFREKTKPYWRHSDGSERQTWMSPMTTYDNSTNLRNATIARQFFPDQSQFQRLQELKARLDPTDLFSNMGTIPLPSR
jgi:FAD/FMN-containing dehydrogenase